MGYTIQDTIRQMRHFLFCRSLNKANHLAALVQFALHLKENTPVILAVAPASQITYHHTPD